MRACRENMVVGLKSKSMVVPRSQLEGKLTLTTGINFHISVKEWRKNFSVLQLYYVHSKGFISKTCVTKETKMAVYCPAYGSTPDLRQLLFLGSWEKYNQLQLWKSDTLRVRQQIKITSQIILSQLVLAKPS